MKEMITFCGIACNECPTFLAAQADDDQKRAEIAAQWSEQSETDFKPEDINCDGCQSSTGKLFGYTQTCEIRKCGMEKNVSNCAHCSDYSCEKLETIFNMVPDAKKRLDEIRKSL